MTRGWRGWPLQIGLSVVPFVGAIAIFLVGFHRYVDAAVPPSDAVEISATAEKWQWTFTYPNGESAPDLRVPVGRPVHLTLHSRDVVHRLDLPALRIGAEARPDADGSLWFTAARAGESLLVGGDVPAEMVTRLAVLEPAAFDDFLDDGSRLPPAEYGHKLYAKSLCQTCHSIDGSIGTAPSFKGLFGKTETLADGATVRVDEAYVRESILNPTAKVVRGFQPVMPVFQGQLSDKQIDALIAFLKSVQR
jgi:cytochrome c oxidase subunit 2